MAYPVVEDGSRHGGGFFVWQGYQLYVFCEGINDAEHKLFSIFGSFEGSKEVDVNSLDGLSGLQEAGDQIRNQGGAHLLHLASVAAELFLWSLRACHGHAAYFCGYLPRLKGLMFWVRTG